MEDASRWLWGHIDHQTSVTVPRLYRFHHLSVWRQLRPVWREIMNRTLHPIQNKDRRPSVVVRRLFRLRFQGYLKNPELIVLEKHLVVSWCSDNSVQRRVPARWV